MQLFAFLDTVDPRGGRTLVVAGAHRLFNLGRAIRARPLGQLMRREAFFGALCRDAVEEAWDHARLMNHAGAVGDIVLEVLELTGGSGDAYRVDLRAVHAAARNATDRPRMMATHRFWRCARDLISHNLKGDPDV